METPLAVTVTAVNDAPTSAGLSPVVVDEDASPTALTLTSHFADIEDGASGLVYAVVGNTNPGLFSSVSIADGVLTVAYVPNASGSATLTVRATDAGGLWVETPFSVTVNPVNDAPTSAGLPAVAVAEDAAPSTVNLTDHFADIEDGPAGLVYTVANNPFPELFSSVSAAGGVLTLSFAPNASGTVLLTARATDMAERMGGCPAPVSISLVERCPVIHSGLERERRV